LLASKSTLEEEVLITVKRGIYKQGPNHFCPCLYSDNKGSATQIQNLVHPKPPKSEPWAVMSFNFLCLQNQNSKLERRTYEKGEREKRDEKS
jgi:hypothetical protein